MRRLLPLAAVLAAGPAVLSCADEIGAPPPAEAYYTLWGSLDPSASRQALRVVPVLQEIDAERPEPLDAVVTTTDLATGRVYPWRDSTVTFPSGRVGHVFLADQPVGYGRSQLVTVARSDGATTTAYVRMPPEVVPFRESTINVASDTQYPVFWPGAPRLDVVEVRYYLRDNYTCEKFYLTSPGSDGVVTAEPTESGWRTFWSERRVHARSFSNYPRPVFILETTIVAEVSTADARPPGGVFGGDLYFDPGTFTNVERGFGLVVGAYRRAITWTQPEPQCFGWPPTS